jgi:hypothetical protein
MDADHVLAFRLGRCGLARRTTADLAEAARCPASDFARDAALLALAARVDDVTREDYDDAVDGGSLVLGHAVRCALHAHHPDDAALYGPALVSPVDDELAAEIGGPVPGQLEQAGVAATDALAEVVAAIEDALADGAALDKDGLHDAMRERVREALLPWCPTCKSHHVAPNLWRYAARKAGTRLDADRRYLLVDHGPAPPEGEAVRRYLRFYGPGRPADFAAWAGMTGRHAKRVWAETEDELVEVRVAGAKAWLLAEDEAGLAAPPEAEGVRLLPPGDPYLQKPNRALLAPDDILRRDLFRAVASPGVVLREGRLAGSWKAKLARGKLEVHVRTLGRLARAGVAEEAARVAALRGAADVTLLLG